MASSMPSECWEKVVHDTPEIDGGLLMDLLDEPHVEDAEDEKLGCVIRSLEEEIGPSAIDDSSLVESKFGNSDDCMDYGLVNVGLEDGDGRSRSTCHIDDPFDWAHIDMVPDCGAIENWYLDTCTNEVGMVEFEDVRDYSPFYYGDTSIEHAYSPLWQET